MVAGPDVYLYHKEDTERYVLANLNIVSASEFGILAQSGPRQDLRVVGVTCAWCRAHGHPLCFPGREIP